MAGTEEEKVVAIVGSGILGLSIALQLRIEGNYRVIIVARDLPNDLESREFASPWAGANWASTTSSKEQQKLDGATFKQWQIWAKQLPETIIAEMPFTEYTHTMAHDQQVDDWRSAFLPHYRTRTSTDGQKATEFTGITMHVPHFLKFLEGQLLQSEPSTFVPRLAGESEVKVQRPVQFIRAMLQSLSDVFDYVPDADLIVNATGLGAKFLKDVQDDTVYPIRGQTVLIEASRRMSEGMQCIMKGPKTGNFNVFKSAPEDQEFSYIIPRAKSGAIICGGCAIPNDWTTEVDLAMSDRILQRCVKVLPELLGDDVDPNSGDAWKSIKVLGHNLGLRPARRDGMRIELQSLSAGEREYQVLHAYGAAGGGFQSGHGVAVAACQKIAGHFARGL